MLAEIVFDLEDEFFYKASPLFLLAPVSLEMRI